MAKHVVFVQNGQTVSNMFSKQWELPTKGTGVSRFSLASTLDLHCKATEKIKLEKGNLEAGPCMNPDWSLLSSKGRAFNNRFLCEQTKYLRTMFAGRSRVVKRVKGLREN